MEGDCAEDREGVDDPEGLCWGVCVDRVEGVFRGEALETTEGEDDTVGVGEERGVRLPVLERLSSGLALGENTPDQVGEDVPELEEDCERGGDQEGSGEAVALEKEDSDQEGLWDTVGVTLPLGLILEELVGEEGIDRVLEGERENESLLEKLELPLPTPETVLWGLTDGVDVGLTVRVDCVLEDREERGDRVEVKVTTMLLDCTFVRETDGQEVELGVSRGDWERHEEREGEVDVEGEIRPERDKRGDSVVLGLNSGVEDTETLGDTQGEGSELEESVSQPEGVKSGVVVRVPIPLKEGPVEGVAKDVNEAWSGVPEEERDVKGLELFKGLPEPVREVLTEDDRDGDPVELPVPLTLGEGVVECDTVEDALTLGVPPGTERVGDTELKGVRVGLGLEVEEPQSVAPELMEGEFEDEEHTVEVVEGEEMSEELEERVGSCVEVELEETGGEGESLKLVEVDGVPPTLLGDASLV